jgi:hypothetical protein
MHEQLAGGGRLLCGRIEQDGGSTPAWLQNQLGQVHGGCWEMPGPNPAGQTSLRVGMESLTPLVRLPSRMFMVHARLTPAQHFVVSN